MRKSKLHVSLTVMLVVILTLLVIAPGAASAAPATSSSNSNSSWYAAGCCWYRVRWGDTLANIAWRYGTSVHYLAWLNGIPNANHIHAGRVLRVPCRCYWRCY
jgi:hypothetical protein